MWFRLFFIFAIIAPSMLSGQAFQTFQAGVGFTYDVYTLSKSNPVFINDSIFFINEEATSNPINGLGLISSDPRSTIYIASQILEKEKANISLALYYSKQWPSVIMVRLNERNSFPASYSPIIAKSEFSLPVSANVKPFSKIKFLKRITFGVGIGPIIKFGNIASRIDGYSLNLKNNREDSVYYETYYQFSKNAFKTLTFNYNWSVQVELSKRINFSVAGRGSIGSVTKPFTVFSERHKIPLKRRGLVYLFTYSFNIPALEKQ